MTKPVKPFRLQGDPMPQSNFAPKLTEADETSLADFQNLELSSVPRTVAMTTNRGDSRTTLPGCPGIRWPLNAAPKRGTVDLSPDLPKTHPSASS